jgi:lyso-ornithine lipid O-acyltransferase
MSSFRAFLLLAGFVALTLPLMPLQWWFVVAGWRLADHLPHWYHRRIATLIGLKIRTEGNVPATGSMLIVSNHTSWLDIVILSTIMPVGFVAKQEVGSWPFFGALARLQRTIFVDRNRRHTTGSETNAISTAIGAGRAIVLFPEGTSGDGRSVKSFKSSYLAAVPNNSVPIIPVTIALKTMWGLPLTHRERPYFAWYGDMPLAGHLWRSLKTGPLAVTVVFHPALHLSHPSARKAVSSTCESLIRSSLARALHGGAEKV